MTTQINNNGDLLGYLLEQSLIAPKSWFGFPQQKLTGIALVHAIAANHADKMSPSEIVQYVTDLNNEIYNGIIKKGQKLRVRVPLASEMEAISKAVDDAEWQTKFESLKESFSSDPDAVIEQTEDDVFVNGKSIKELAIMSAKTEERIVQMVRLLVPTIEGFDMNRISYADVDEEFPFAVQIELMKKIAEVISPGYEETRKN